MTFPLKNTKTLILLNAMSNFALACFKIVLGWLGHSQALSADGLHSLADLTVDVITYIAARFGDMAADQDHPYGHGRIETAAAMGLALLLIATGISIGLHVWHHHFVVLVKPSPLVIIASLAACLIYIILYRINIKAREHNPSALLHAMALHNKSDAQTSAVILLGIIGSVLGVVWLDSLTAILVAGVISYTGMKLAYKSIAELVDTGLDEADLNQIKKVIVNTPGVKTIHQLRTRSMSGFIFVDVHVLVAAYISVSEGHMIGEQVGETLKQVLPRIRDVTVHVDPEDDEQFPLPMVTLPDRKTISHYFLSAWPEAQYYQPYLMLHYLNQKLMIEVHLRVNEINQASLQALQQKCESVLSTFSDDIQICFILKE
jgi:cation diffusion facilitator family transporter